METNNKFYEIQKAISNYFAGDCTADNIAQVMGIESLNADAMYYLDQLVKNADPDDIDEDVENCALDVIRCMSDDIIAKCDAPTMEHCELERGQFYLWCDENNIEHSVSGDIFDFTHHYMAADKRFFHKVGDNFEPVDWYDVPMGGKERSNFVFVFDTIVTSNCEVVALYDYFA